MAGTSDAYLAEVVLFDAVDADPRVRDTDFTYHDEVRALMARAGSLQWGTASGRTLLPPRARGRRRAA